MRGFVGMELERLAGNRGAIVVYPERYEGGTVHGGGHVVPIPEAVFPAMLGPIERRLNTAEVVTEFFRAEAR